MHYGSAQLFFARKDYKPQRVMKITMSYSQRCNIQLKVGINDDVNTKKQTPKHVIFGRQINKIRKVVIY